MICRPRPRYLLLSAFALFFSSPASAQGTGDTPVTTIRCETFCSSSSLRTAGARLTWIDPTLRPGAAGFSASGATPSTPPQLDVTVVRNGFSTNAYATLPTTDQVGASPTASFAAPSSTTPSARAYALRVVGVIRPAIVGAFSLDEAAPGNERRETSLIVENLEPGLRYSWRLRFTSPTGEQSSGVAICVAPVCPADMKE